MRAMNEKPQSLSRNFTPPPSENLTVGSKPRTHNLTVGAGSDERDIVVRGKLRVGWFSFSCCEDSTIIFTELLNDYYHAWRPLIEFIYFLPLQKKSDINRIDVAFIEGAVTSPKQEEAVKKIRAASRKVVAVGACAVSDMPSGQRNTFDAAARQEIEPILARFAYTPMVKKIADVVTVDMTIPGCPMDEAVFLKILNGYLNEFRSNI